MHQLVKSAAATVGVTGIAAMAAVTIGFNSTAVVDPPPPGPIQPPEPTMGETVKARTGAPKAPATVRAAPQITGPAPLPAEVQGLPGD